MTALFLFIDFTTVLQSVRQDYCVGMFGFLLLNLVFRSKHADNNLQELKSFNVIFTFNQSENHNTYSS